MRLEFQIGGHKYDHNPFRHEQPYWVYTYAPGYGYSNGRGVVYGAKLHRRRHPRHHRHPHAHRHHNNYVMNRDGRMHHSNTDNEDEDYENKIESCFFKKINDIEHHMELACGTHRSIKSLPDNGVCYVKFKHLKQFVEMAHPNVEFLNDNIPLYLKEYMDNLEQE